MVKTRVMVKTIAIRKWIARPQDDNADAVRWQLRYMNKWR